jgi:hypothetical protein
MKEDEKSGGEWKVAVPVIAVIVAVVVIFSPEQSAYKTVGQKITGQEEASVERETTLAEMSPKNRAIDACANYHLADVNLIQDGEAMVDNNETDWLVSLAKVGGGHKRCSVSRDGNSILQAYAE